VGNTRGEMAKQCIHIWVHFKKKLKKNDNNLQVVTLLCLWLGACYKHRWILPTQVQCVGRTRTCNYSLPLSLNGCYGKQPNVLHYRKALPQRTVSGTEERSKGKPEWTASEKRLLGLL
jgi:hypothetical protein